MKSRFVGDSVLDFGVYVSLGHRWGSGLTATVLTWAYEVVGFEVIRSILMGKYETICLKIDC